VTGYGIGQSEFLWHSRTLPKLHEAFAKLWKTDDLIVSFDGCGVFRPPEYNPEWRTKGGWYHIDQNCYNKPGLHSIQGLLNYYTSGENDGGFVVVPKSRKMIDYAFANISDIMPHGGRNYCKIPPTTPFWADARCAIKREDENRYELLPVKLVLEAGDLVMWDSRCIHCNTPPSKDNESHKNRLKRLVSYVCMTPASYAQNLEELVGYRILAFQKGFTTSHWPHEFFPSWHTSVKVNGVGADVVNLLPQQTALITGRQFGSWDVYDLAIAEKVLNSNTTHLYL
jgi:hypothetical protein